MAAKDDSDPILANEQRLKFQKQIIQNLHKQLKIYNEAFRQFLNAEKVFCDMLDNLCESSWELKSEFSASLQSLSNIAENGARNLETIPVEEAIVFRDQFSPFEKEIQDYKEKQKIAEAAEKKHMVYMKKKSADADELRKLELAAYEKKTSLGILRRKLSDELPTFYKSRMEFYSTFWRSVFQIRADISRAECETLDQLTELVRGFDVKRDQDRNPGQVRDTYLQGARPHKLHDTATAYEVESSTRSGDEPSSASSSSYRQQPNGQQQQANMQRVPTFGGSDLGSGDSGRGRQPDVPRRGSLRSQGNDYAE